MDDEHFSNVDFFDRINPALIMLKTVKLMKSTLKYFETLGIYPLQQNKNYTFNWISISVLSTMIAILISTGTFFLFKAETIDEYSKTFYAVVTELYFLICFISNIWKMKSILQAIEKNEEFIGKSELTVVIIHVMIRQNQGMRSVMKNKNCLQILGSNNTILWSSFNELSGKIEWMSQRLHFFVTQLTLIGLMSPSLLITIGNYFICDLDNESFYLSCPLTYVRNCIERTL